MKRFNVSILAVVAVLAIGLTAFTKAESSAKRVAVNFCYTALETDLTASCVEDIDVIGQSTSCAIALTQPTKKVSVANIANYITTPIQCNEVQTTFCCAHLVLDQQPCPGQVLLNFRDQSGTSFTARPAKIQAVFCKS